MRLYVQTNGKEVPLEFERQGTALSFRFGDDSVDKADVEEPEPGVYSVLWKGRSYEARVERGEGLIIVSIGGHRFEIAVRDPRSWDRKRHGAGIEGRQNVTSPMPGKVVRVLVGVGEPVTAGQGLMVVEAMKMQNELKSPKAGRVATLHATEGTAVTAGLVLATIE